MCFSATASFVASGVLATSGVASWRTAKKKERILALIPILFAIQQFTEGMQWLVDKPSPASTMFGVLFLVFAFLTWPIYIPWVIRRLEPNKTIKRWLSVLQWIGILVSAFLFGSTLLHGMTVTVDAHHIVYNVGLPFAEAWILAYIIATIGALFLSSNRFFRLFGLLSLMSVFVAFWFFETAFISVWCFFAAVLSVYILLYLHLRPKHRWLSYLFGR